MKIDDSIKKTGGLPVGPTSTRAGAAAGTGAQASVRPAATAGSDNVHISTQLKTLASQVASTGGVFDAGKVEEIKAAIAGGQFQVDAAKVANGLIESVRDLISARKH